jgi:hypothetical protein
MRALVLGVAAAVALVGAQVATASSANAAALSCTVRVPNPTQQYAAYVYTLIEVNCNKSVSFIGGYVSLYRDGTWLGSVSTYLYNTPYAYKINMVSCVPGNYYAVGYGFANLDGGAPDVAQSITSPTAAIACT